MKYPKEYLLEIKNRLNISTVVSKTINLNNNVISEVNQVHSNNIVVSEDFKMNYKADGMISKNDNLALKISTAEKFQEQIYGKKLSLIQMSAIWCNPCQNL